MFFKPELARFSCEKPQKMAMKAGFPRFHPIAMQLLFSIA